MKDRTKSKGPPVKKSKSKGNASLNTSNTAKVSTINQDSPDNLSLNIDFRQLFEKSPDAIVILDLKGFITSFNPATLKIAGLTEEELMGKHFSKISSIHPRDLPRLAKMFGSFLIEKIPKPFEVSFHHKDGTIRWGEVSIGLVKKNGKLTGIQAVIRDITSRKRLKQNLEKERQELELIIDSSPVLVFYKDKKGRFLRVNYAFAEALQMPAEKFIGKTVFDIYSAEIAQSMTNDDQEVFKSGRPKLNIIEQYESASGTRWVQTDKIPIFDKGNTVGLIGFAQDITERKQAEDKLRESELRYRTLFEQSPYGVTITNFETTEILEFNDIACAHLGYTRDEFERMKISDLDKESTLEEMKNNVAESARQGRYEFMTKFSTKQGELRDVMLSIKPIEIAGKTYIISIHHDITEQIKMRETLLENEKKFRELFEQSRDAIYICSKDGNFFDFNQATLDLFGYTREELLATNAIELYVKSSDRKRFQQSIEKKDFVKDYEVKFRKKDGTVLDCLLTANVLRDDSGNIMGYQGIIRNVTEQKRMESELKLRAKLLDSTRDAIILRDIAGNILYANETAYKSLGYSKEEFLNMKIGQISASAHKTNEQMLKVLRKKENFVFEDSILNKDGSASPIEVNAINIELEDRDVILSVGRDITERKKAEETLRISEMKYRKLVENASVGIVITEKGKILFSNSKESELFGYENPSALCGHSITEFIHKDDLPILRNIAEQLNNGMGMTTPVTFRGIRDDGNELIIEAFAVPFPFESTNAILSFHIDVTERQKTEEALKHRETLMETASAIATEFLNIPIEEIDKSINEALKTVGELCNSDRSYIFLFSRDRNKANCTHEWCTEVIEPQISTLQNIPWKKMKTVELMLREGVLNIPDVSKFFPKYTFEKKEFQRQGIQSVISVPLITRGDIIGFIGLDSVKIRRTWSENIATFLKITGEIFASALKHKETETSLRESEEKYRNVVERAASGICIIQDRTIKYANPRLAEMWGDTVEKIIDTPFTNYIHPDELPKIANNYKRRMAGEQVPPIYETVLRSKDGSKLAAELNVGIIEYQGKPAELVIIQDLTERKQAEDKIRIFSNAVEEAIDAIAITDMKGLITHANSAMEKLYGYKKGEMVGETVINFGANLEKANKIMSSMLKNGSWHGELEGIKKNRETFPLLLSLSTVRDDKGNPVAMMGANRDITEIKQAEEALKKSEIKYRSLFEDSKDPVYTTSREGKLIEFNQATLDLLGYSKEEMIELPVLEIYANPKDRRKFQQAIEANGSVKDYEVQFRKKNGSIIDCLITATVWLNPDGSIGGYRGIMHDITYIKKAEEERQKNTEKLLEAMKSTISAMARTIEIRDPYTAGHQRRVANLAQAIARELNMSESKIEGVYLAGIIHDIGKMYVPADILNRPGKLNSLEFGIIKTHAQAGYDIVKDIEFPWDISDAILNHHERLDGSGYPNGLKGKKINPEARILAVADVVEAMASHRPYRPALDIEKALEEIQQNKDKLYDPDVVNACVKLFTEKGFKLEE